MLLSQRSQNSMIQVANYQVAVTNSVLLMGTLTFVWTEQEILLFGTSL